MIISCPQCGFSRTVPDLGIPPTAELATCPKCEARFRFRTVVSKEERLLAPEEQPKPSFSKRKDLWDTVTTLHQQWEEADQLNRDAIKDKPKPKAAAGHLRENFSEDAASDDDFPFELSQGETKETLRTGQKGTTPLGADPDDPDFPDLSHMLAEDDLAAAQTQEETVPPRPESPLADTGFPDADNYHQRDPDLNYQKVAQEQEARTLTKNEPWLAYVDAVHPIPWEHPDRYGYIKGLYQTILRVLLAAPRFFSTMPGQGSLRPALLFYVILGVFEYTMNSVWMYAFYHVATPSAAEANAMLMAQPTLSMYLLAPVKYLILFYVFSWTFQGMLQLVAPEKARFTSTARIVGYAAAPAVLCLVPYLGIFISLGWSAVCLLIGMRYAYHLSWQKTCLTVLPVYGFVLLLMFVFAQQAFTLLQGA